LLILPLSWAKGLPRLVLDSDGFEIQHLLGFRRKQWGNIAGFERGLLLVRFRYPMSAGGFWNKLTREPSLIPFFGLGKEEFTTLLIAWRERALFRPQ
jgi:hypothetical protein